MKRSFSGNLVVKNASLLVAAKFIGYIFPLITLPVLTRALGPNGYGQLQYVHSIIAFCLLFTEYGTSITATQKIATANGDEQAIQEIFYRTIFMRLALCVFAYFGFLVFGMSQHFTANQYLWVTLSFLMPLGEAVNPTWFFIGQQSTAMIAINTLIARAIALPLIVLLVRSENNLTMAAFLTIQPWALSGVLNFFAAKKNLPKTLMPKMRWTWLVQNLREGFHAAVSNLSANASQSLATIILGVSAPAVAVAKFGAALIMTTAAKQVLFPISQVVFAHSIAIKAQGKTQEAKSKVFAYGIILLLGIGTWFTIYIAAAFVIPLFFGAKFDGSVPVLKVMAPIPLIFIVGQTAALEFLFAKNLGIYVSRATVAGTIVCVSTSVLLASRHQEMGIAIAILAGEVVATGMILFSAIFAHRKKREGEISCA
jgi:O-antigen/teichoic acid export membrane protein